MAKEIFLPYGTTGVTTLYVSIRRPSDGFYWYTVGAAFEAFNSAHVATGYGIALTEMGTSGQYYADFPVGITAAGRYEIPAYQRVGASPAWPADGKPIWGQPGFEWSGSAVVVPSVTQTADAGAAMALLAGLFKSATVSTATSATSFVVEFDGAQSAAGLAGVWCSITTDGRSPEKLAIATATSVDPTHITLTFAGTGFGVAPQAGDSVLIG